MRRKIFLAVSVLAGLMALVSACLPLHGIPGKSWVFYTLTPPGGEEAFYLEFQEILRREGRRPNPGINDTQGVRARAVESTNFYTIAWAANTAADPNPSTEFGIACKGLGITFWPRQFYIAVGTMRPFGSDARSRALSDRLRQAIKAAGYPVQDEKFPCGGEVLEGAAP